MPNGSMQRGQVTPDNLVAAAVVAIILLVALVASAAPRIADRPPVPALPGDPPSDAPVVTGEEPLPHLAFSRDRIPVADAPGTDAGQVSVVGPLVPLPVVGREGAHVEVITPCYLRGWVPASAVGVAVPPERDPGEFVVVIDPGHGGHDPGAVGPTGLTEAEVNLDVSVRLARLLVDHPAGPAFRVVLTRRGDHDASLSYRSAVANAAQADIFMSVHFNTGPRSVSPHPGTEVYHQVVSPESRRLAGLAYEEITATLHSFGDVPWSAGPSIGALARLGQGGGDFYSVLRQTGVPAVLVEAAVISNPQEEQLLRSASIRQRIAEALHRSVVRYATTQDPGSGHRDPGYGSGGRASVRCVDPR